MLIRIQAAPAGLRQVNVRRIPYIWWALIRLLVIVGRVARSAHLRISVPNIVIVFIDEVCPLLLCVHNIQMSSDRITRKRGVIFFLGYSDWSYWIAGHRTFCSIVLDISLSYTKIFTL